MDDEHVGTLSYGLRPATLDDASFLADVSLVALRELREPPADFDENAWRSGFISWTEEQVRGEIPFSSTSVIELNGERVGRLRVVRDGRRIELAGIQLLPAAQSRGIGTDVVEALKSEAADSGLPFELTVERDNPRARALYERLGLVKFADDGDEERFRWTAVP
jgi:ribosomal protein S18 acetylase RimI-like enzyme